MSLTPNEIEVLKSLGKTDEEIAAIANLNNVQTQPQNKNVSVQPKSANFPTRTDSLTPNEIEVLKSLGKTDEEIAAIAKLENGVSQATPTTWTQTAATAAAGLVPPLVSALPAVGLGALGLYAAKKGGQFIVNKMDERAEKRELIRRGLDPKKYILDPKTGVAGFRLDVDPRVVKPVAPTTAPNIPKQPSPPVRVGPVAALATIPAAVSAGVEAAKEGIANIPQRFSQQVGKEVESLRQAGAQGAVDVAGRTAAGIYGSPVDMMAQSLNIAPLRVLNYLITGNVNPPQQPVGGSESVGRVLEQAGVITPERRPITETVAGVVLPMAPAAVRSASRSAVNAMAKGKPVTPVAPVSKEEFYIGESGVPRLDVMGAADNVPLPPKREPQRIIPSQIAPAQPTPIPSAAPTPAAQTGQVTLAAPTPLPTPKPNPVEDTLGRIRSQLGDTSDDVIDQVFVSTRAKDIIAEAKNAGIVIDKKAANQVAQGEIQTYRKTQAEKAAEEARLAKEKQQRDWEASPEGQAFAKNKQEVDDLISQDPDFASRMRDQTAYNNAINDPAYRQRMLDDIARAKEQAAKVAAEREKKIQELQARKNVLTTPEPKVESVAPAPKASGADLIEQIRAKGAAQKAQRTEESSVPTPTPAASNVPVVESPVASTQPVGKPSLETLRKKLQENPPSPEELAEIERLNQIRKNRSEAQKASQPARRSREEAAKSIAQTTITGTKTPNVNYDDIVAQAKDTGVYLDWSKFPKVETMSVKEARKAVKKWIDESTRNYDPKNPYPERPSNEGGQLFSFDNPTPKVVKYDDLKNFYNNKELLKFTQGNDWYENELNKLWEIYANSRIEKPKKEQIQSLRQIFEEQHGFNKD